jgi:class 3 adenylate cyclase
LAIAAQESLRGSVSDDVIDAAIAALRKQLGEEGEERRRQVTVLFADVSGFTALSERLDPEVLANLMNRLWSLLDAAIVDNGGHIDKHMGDAVMAVWGVHATREDDPERGVRAAL